MPRTNLRLNLRISRGTQQIEPCLSSASGLIVQGENHSGSSPAFVVTQQPLICKLRHLRT